MSKWDGRQHAADAERVPPDDGAGGQERGIDERGVSVILYSPWVSFERTLSIVAGDLLPLESAFKPSYSTAMNLWQRPGDQERLADLYARSLRRFQQGVRLSALASERDEQKLHFERLAERAAHDPLPGSWRAELAQTEKVLDQAHRAARSRPELWSPAWGWCWSGSAT